MTMLRVTLSPNSQDWINTDLVTSAKHYVPTGENPVLELTFATAASVTLSTPADIANAAKNLGLSFSR
jgi:hypothetical protein